MNKIENVEISYQPQTHGSCLVTFYRQHSDMNYFPRPKSWQRLLNCSKKLKTRYSEMNSAAILIVYDVV